MSTLNALKIQQYRRSLLTNLDLYYPTPCTVRSLWRTICGYDPSYDFSLLKKDLVYFRDKGWLDFIDDRIGGFSDFEDKVVKLTASGKEIAERTRTDEALEI